MSDTQDELITQFNDVTGASSDRAKFYLEAANWELQLALASFYEGDQEESMSEEVAQIDDTGSDDDNVTIPEPSDVVEQTARPSRPKFSKTKSSSTPRIVTLHNMNKSSSDDDEEQGQAFYAGGSERSGQQVLGPPRKNPIKDYVSEVFRSAQESGAEVVPSHGMAGPSSGSNIFRGQGYRLGQTSNDHVALPVGATQRERPPVIDSAVLKLWRQGFSINDGELRPYEDPANKEFLESVMKGIIPAELREQGGMSVHVDLEDHRHEDFVQGPKKIKTFSGKGHTLGSPSPSLSSDSTPVVVGASAVEKTKPTNSEDELKANDELKIDESQPTTSIQVRLADGSRLSTRFNLFHTVGDIRRFIITARPQYSAQTFSLLTTYPSKELTDASETIEKAGLKNSAILQRMK